MLAVKKELFMANAKKGLRLLSFSIILNIGWGIAYSILQGNSKNLSDALVKFLSYGILVTGVIAVVCYVIDLIGLHIAGKDNNHFHRASFLRIASLVLAVVCLILGAINVAKPETEKIIATITNVVNIFSAVAEVVVITSIVKGCKEISPRVKGLSNFVYGCFIIQLLITVILPFLVTYLVGADGKFSSSVGIAILALAVVYSIVAILYVIFYVILIFRATHNVGKARR